MIIFCFVLLSGQCLLREHTHASTLQLNGHMPSIRAALDSRRSHRLVGSHHLNPPKMPQPHLPRGRPNSFPQFNQPLTIDVNEDRLPNHFQMETYTEIGRRPPPPSYVNAESNQNEISYSEFNTFGLFFTSQLIRCWSLHQGPILLFFTSSPPTAPAVVLSHE